MPSNLPTQPESQGRLFVVATPIGHLEDITYRAIKVLNEVDLIAAEDTRHTRRLLNAHGIQCQLTAFHEHNEKQKTTKLIETLIHGKDLALVTDAGTPAVSDPGYRLVTAAAANGIQVVPIPGPSAVVTALSAAGLATDAFTFVGFPSRSKNNRMKQLHQLALLPHTVVYYQSPRRIIGFLKEMLIVCGDRQMVLARELTKIHEEFLRGRISEIIATLEKRQGIKGECTLLVSGAEPVTLTLEQIEPQIVRALQGKDQTLSSLAKNLARQTGVSRKEIYAKAMELKKD